jgi:ketosteroid isomerase-like protein
MSDERKVQEVLARYVRATDQRDGKAQGALFTDEAVVQIYTKTGRDSHHTTFDHIIDGPIESGYYDTDLRRVDGEWKIVKHSVLMDMPIAVPAAR